MGQLALAALLVVPVVSLVGLPYFKNLLEHGKASLHQAARYGDLPAVRSLIAAGADVNAADWAGRSPLYYALWANDDHAIADALVAAGANVDARPVDQMLNLMSVVFMDPPDVKANPGSGPTLLHLAEAPPIVEFLIAAGADIHARNHKGETPLHRAVARASRRDKYGDGLAIVSLLLAAGADVNARAERFGETPLHKAALHHTEPHGRGPSVAEALLAAGADVNAKDDDGWTSLHDAVHRRGGGLPMVEFLLAAGADVDASNRGVTPLHRTTFDNNDPSVIRALIAAGADVNAKYKSGETALHYAAQWNNESATTKALLAAGADVNARTRRGKTPLDFAIEEENEVVIPLLEAAGGVASAQ